MKALLALPLVFTLVACAAGKEAPVEVETDAIGNAFTAFIAWQIERGNLPSADWSEEDLADFRFACALAGTVADGVRFRDYPDVTGAEINAACERAALL